MIIDNFYEFATIFFMNYQTHQVTLKMIVDIVSMENKCKTILIETENDSISEYGEDEMDNSCESHSV